MTFYEEAHYIFVPGKEKEIMIDRLDDIGLNLAMKSKL